MRLFEMAKTCDLLKIAEKHFHLRKRGNGYAANHCPHCPPGKNDAMSIYPSDGIWRWHCFRCARGGTVIDFAAAIWGTSEREAAMRLVKSTDPGKADPSHGAPKKVKASQDVMKNAITQLLNNGHTNLKECFEYLEQRGISKKTANEAIRRGMLRFLPANPFQANKFLLKNLGIKTLREAGFLKPEARWPGIAFRPLVFFFPGYTAAEFRLARQPKEGEPKAIRYGYIERPWWWSAGDSISTIYIVEGVIDLLSMVEIGLEEGEAVMGIPGVTSWKQEWFSAAKSAHPDARFVIALDADNAGRQATHSIRQFLESMEVAVSEKTPECGTDWNDFLVLSRAA